MNIAIVVQGLFEKSDSIGYDAVFQYKALSNMLVTDKVQIFAETFDPARHPESNIQEISKLYEFIKNPTESKIIYHYCDGWPTLDDFIIKYAGTVCIRWHNNTPPWFFLQNNLRSLDRSLNGFKTIQKFFECDHIKFWVNSDFSGRQLAILGARPERIASVFPASRYLEDVVPASAPPRDPFASDSLRILFVGRVVAHKGHKHVIAVAATLQKVLGVPVVVDFPGREDKSAREFNASLRALAADPGLVVDFPGEVSDAELVDLYQKADVFLCVSEHEGFGLPIFEAMRSGVPVVVWAATALKELLDGHPLALPDFDIAAFAAAIASLKVPEIRRRVLLFQQTILERYTAGIVREQLYQALSYTGKPRNTTTIREQDYNYADDKSERDVAHFYNLYRVAYDGLSSNLRSLPHDFAMNYVSLYDIQTYEELQNLSSKTRFGGSENLSGAEKAVLIEAAEFSNFGGTFDGKAILFNLPLGHEGHIIYGPYAPFPVGRFEITMLVDLSLETWRGVLVLDVHSASQGIIAKKDYELIPEASQLGLRLQFENFIPREVIEFRVLIKSFSRGALSFKGAKVMKIASLQDLVANGRIELQYLPAENVASASDAGAAGLLGRMFKGSSDEQRASTLFQQADRARDARYWGQAADLYEAGLRISPRSFSHLVQMANVLRELGRYRAAELAYLKAHQLNPSDPGLNFEMGNLYKLMGETINAENKYLQALAGNRIAFSALAELRNLGVPTDQILLSLTPA